MTAPTAPQDPSAIAKLLQGLNTTMSDPSNAGTIGLAQGLLAASAPHMLTPVSMGQAMGQGLASSQQYQGEALQNALARLSLPMRAMKVAAFRNAWQTMNDPSASDADKATAGAVLTNMFSPGMGPAMIANSAPIQAARVRAESQNKPLTVGPGARVYGPTGAPSVGAQGALPEGTAQAPGSLDLSFLPGAPGAIAANAFNKAGGGAAGAYPYSAALSYHTPAPGAAGATLGPRPGPFAPQGVPPQGAAAPPSPQALAAAQALARQRQVGTMQGVTQAAQASGAPVPFRIPPQPYIQPPPSTGGVGPNPSAPGTPASSREIGQTPQGRAYTAAAMRALSQQAQGQPGPRPVLGLPPRAQGTGNGLVAPGLSPAQVELQKQAAQQTAAQESQGTHETEAAQAQLARLTEMQSALTRIPLGGNLAKVYEGIGNALNFAGIKVPGLTAMQEYAKYRTNFVADAARKMGAQVSYQEVGYIAKGVPDFTLAGNAPKALVAQLSGAAQYDIARNQALQFFENSVPNPYGKAYQHTSRGFEQYWQGTGVTPGSLMFMNTLFALPPADRGEYLQNFRSTLTGKVYLQQYAKAQAFLRQNPGLVPFWSKQ
ncbi:MAG: hypothetical protein ACREFT_01035 [Acetobacteraceae bacterium]